MNQNEWEMVGGTVMNEGEMVALGLIKGERWHWDEGMPPDCHNEKGGG